MKQSLFKEEMSLDELFKTGQEAAWLLGNEAFQVAVDKVYNDTIIQEDVAVSKINPDMRAQAAEVKHYSQQRSALRDVVAQLNRYAMKAKDLNSNS